MIIKSDKIPGARDVMVSGDSEFKPDLLIAQGKDAIVLSPEQITPLIKALLSLPGAISADELQMIVAEKQKQEFTASSMTYEEAVKCLKAKPYGLSLPQAIEAVDEATNYGDALIMGHPYMPKNIPDSIAMKDDRYYLTYSK